MVTPKRLLFLTAKWLLISALVVFCTVYAADELTFQYKIHSAQSADAFGAVDMQRVLAIQMKGGKVQYTMDQVHAAQMQQCVYSLFPHGGLSPCWYLVRQSQKAVPMMIFWGFRGEFIPRKIGPRPF